MPTRKIYMQDLNQMRHTAKVTAVGHNEKGYFVYLDETIFHPQGGGQPSDLGTINSVPVHLLAHEGEEVAHYFTTDPGLSVGDSVALAIDPAKRLQHAVLHTTGHLLASIIREQFGFPEQTGAHHFPGEARVTFKPSGSKPAPTPDQLIAAVKQIVAEKRPVTVMMKDGERFILIPGFEPGRCGGTHLTNTAEISDFVIRAIKFDKKKDAYSFGYDVSYNFEYVPSTSESVTTEVTAQPVPSAGAGGPSDVATGVEVLANGVAGLRC